MKLEIASTSNFENGDCNVLIYENRYKAVCLPMKIVIASMINYEKRNCKYG